MSIFSTLVQTVEKGGIAALPGAIVTADEQAIAWGKQIVTKAEANPTYGSLVTTVVQDTNQLVGTAAEWIGTGLEGDLGNFSEELAALVVKYAPVVLGGANPVTAAGTTLLGALVDVGQAVIQHEVLALQGSSAAPAAAA